MLFLFSYNANERNIIILLGEKKQHYAALQFARLQNVKIKLLILSETERNIMIAKKKTFIEALKKNMGNVSATCDAIAKATGKTFARATYYRWYNSDKEFAEAADSVDDYLLDVAEASLNKKIKSGNLTAIIFYLKTKGKKRGYVEKIEVEKPKDPVFAIFDARGTDPNAEQEDDEEFQDNEFEDEDDD